MSLIEFAGIYKAYGQTGSSHRVEALRGLTLQISAGEIFAVAGLNGAGKTTALKIMLGLCRADSGSVRLFPEQAQPFARHLLGFAPEEPDLPPYLTVTEFLGCACELSEVEPSPELLGRAVQMLDLDAERDRLIDELSKGTRQRVSLAAAIIHRPSLVVLDEPASGLDPLGRKLIKNVIRQLNSEGVTILFTTHILSDLPGLCSRIGILDRGSLVFSGSPADFCDSDSLPVLEERFAALVARNGVVEP